MQWFKVTKQLDEYGKKAAELRLARNILQVDLAAKAGVTQATVSHLETGLSHRASAINEDTKADILAIGRALGLGEFDFGPPGKKFDYASYGAGSVRRHKAKVVTAKPKAPLSNGTPKVDTVDAQVKDTVLLSLLNSVAKGDLQPENALRAIKAQF